MSSPKITGPDLTKIATESIQPDKRKSSQYYLHSSTNLSQNTTTTKKISLSKNPKGAFFTKPSLTAIKSISPSRKPYLASHRSELTPKIAPIRIGLPTRPHATINPKSSGYGGLDLPPKKHKYNLFVPTMKKDWNHEYDQNIICQHSRGFDGNLRHTYARAQGLSDGGYYSAEFTSNFLKSLKAKDLGWGSGSGVGEVGEVGGEGSKVSMDKRSQW